MQSYSSTQKDICTLSLPVKYRSIILEMCDWLNDGKLDMYNPRYTQLKLLINQHSQEIQDIQILNPKILLNDFMLTVDDLRVILRLSKEFATNRTQLNTYLNWLGCKTIKGNLIPVGYLSKSGMITIQEFKEREKLYLESQNWNGKVAHKRYLLDLCSQKIINGYTKNIDDKIKFEIANNHKRIFSNLDC